MEEKKFLNEERYQKNAKSLKIIGIIVLVIGIVIAVLGVVFVVKGFSGFASIPGSNVDDPAVMAKSAFGGIGTTAAGAFTLLGGFTVVAIGIGLLIFAHKREIMAFTAQQTVPVMKEVAEDVAPTVGNVAGSIAKGIKDGLKDEDK